jgi:DNA-directed RNA polymerase specialized sigma24 family protein
MQTTTTETKPAPLWTDDQAVTLLAMAERMLKKRLRLYGMTMQRSDIDDITASAFMAALKKLQATPPQTAKDIRLAIWWSVRTHLLDWIRERSNEAEALTPIAGDDPVDCFDVPDSQPEEYYLPAYVERLCRSVGELRAAVVLSGQTLDGRTFLEMPIAMAAEQLQMSETSVRRMREVLRARFALFAPENADPR